MPSKAECPLNKRQAPPLAPVPGDSIACPKPPIKNSKQRKEEKNEERIVNFQRPIGQR